MDVRDFCFETSEIQLQCKVTSSCLREPTLPLLLINYFYHFLFICPIYHRCKLQSNVACYVIPFSFLFFKAEMFWRGEARMGEVWVGGMPRIEMTGKKWREGGVRSSVSFSKVLRHSSLAFYCMYGTKLRPGIWRMLGILRAFDVWAGKHCCVYVTITPTGHSSEGGLFVCVCARARVCVRVLVFMVCILGERTQLSSALAVIICKLASASLHSFCPHLSFKQRKGRGSRAGFVALRVEMMHGRSPLACPSIWFASILHVALICGVPCWNVLQNWVKETSNIIKNSDCCRCVKKSTCVWDSFSVSVCAHYVSLSSQSACVCVRLWRVCWLVIMCLG